MKSAIVFCVLSVAVMAFARPEEEKYTDRYDSLDLDEILNNKAILDNYCRCLLEKQVKCPPEAKELKSHMKEALETDCAKCTDTQKTSTRKVIAHLINHEEVCWKELSEKYDPTGKYTAKYEKELKEIKA